MKCETLTKKTTKKKSYTYKHRMDRSNKGNALRVDIIVVSPTYIHELSSHMRIPTRSKSVCGPLRVYDKINREG